MPNTYTQLYVHFVFATRHRMRFLTENIQQDLFCYMGGITEKSNCFMHCIGGVEDHIHLLIGVHPEISVSQLAHKLKANSSRFINEKAWSPWKFEW